jgi:2-polyprenyl-3-methyl-5-hydroxy-6-metoxy-1,4-benzoquinol methylase
MHKSISDHYLGEQGKAYQSARQTDPSDRGYAIDFEYFRPYLQGGDAVLDFGCGNGGILRHIRQLVTRVDGVEVNPSVRQVAVASGVTIYSHLENVPAENRYDVVISNHVLEHVRDVCGILESIRRVLKPGGLLLLKLPFDDANSRYQRMSSTRDIDHHLYTWTPRLLANLLQETGYEVRSCEIITSAWHPRLFFTERFGLHWLAFWLFAILKRRRQTFAVAVNPDS